MYCAWKTLTVQELLWHGYQREEGRCRRPKEHWRRTVENERERNRLMRHRTLAEAKVAAQDKGARRKRVLAYLCCWNNLPNIISCKRLISQFRPARTPDLWHNSLQLSQKEVPIRRSIKNKQYIVLRYESQNRPQLVEVSLKLAACSHFKVGFKSSWKHLELVIFYLACCGQALTIIDCW